MLILFVMLPKVDYVLISSLFCVKNQVVRALRLYEPEISVQAEGIYECIVWNHLAAGRWFFFCLIEITMK